MFSFTFLFLNSSVLEKIFDTDNNLIQKLVFSSFKPLINLMPVYVSGVSKQNISLDYIKLRLSNDKQPISHLVFKHSHHYLTREVN